MRDCLAGGGGWHPYRVRYIAVINTLSLSDLELEHGFANILLQHELVSGDAGVRGVLRVCVEHLKYQRAWVNILPNARVE